MKASNDESDSRAAQSGATERIEIDLYTDLLAFSVMSPEQQRVYLETPQARGFDLPPQTPEPPVSRFGPASSEVENVIRFSGPLLLPHAAWAAAVLALVTCPSCASKADGRDLFCIACGAFLDAT